MESCFIPDSHSTGAMVVTVVIAMCLVGWLSSLIEKWAWHRYPRRAEDYDDRRRFQTVMFMPALIIGVAAWGWMLVEWREWYCF